MPGKQSGSIVGNAGVVTLTANGAPLDVINLVGVDLVAHVFERVAADGGLIVVLTRRDMDRARVEATFGFDELAEKKL